MIVAPGINELDGYTDMILSVFKTRQPLRSRPWSKPESTLRRLRPDVPVVKTTDAGHADDAGGRGGPGLGWTTLG